jgi:hypothetical protein
MRLRIHWRAVEEIEYEMDITTSGSSRSETLRCR